MVGIFCVLEKCEKEQVIAICDTLSNEKVSHIFIYLFYRMAEALTAAADANNDGKLQFDEFKNAIEIVSQGQSA